MLQRIEDLPVGVVGVAASGIVTAADYRRVLEPLLADARAGGGKIRFVYRFAPDFRRFTAGGAYKDVQVGFRHLRTFERCAVVADEDWIRASTRALATTVPCLVRTFRNAEWSQAVDWLSAPAEARALEHRLLGDRGVLVLELRGPLRVEDFDAVAGDVDPWIERHGELRGIVVAAPAFPGWQTLGSLFRHVGFVRDHQRKVERIAIAAGGRMAELGPRLFGRFLHPEVRRFQPGAVDEAIAWASGADGAPMSEQRVVTQVEGTEHISP